MGVDLEGGGAAAAMAEAGGGVADVDAGGEQVRGGVVPQALDIDRNPRHLGRAGDLVGGPVGVPRRRAAVVGEHERVPGQLDPGRGPGGGRLLVEAAQHVAGGRVDGQAAVLVGLGVLLDPLAAGDDVGARDVNDPGVRGRYGASAARTVRRGGHR